MKRLGLALSSGGPRGVAHVGVLRALVEAGLPIHALAGASVGAQVGGLFAAGVSLEEIAGLWQDAGWSRIARSLIPTRPWRGWSSGEEIRRTLRVLVGERRIEELPVRFAAVATDLQSGAEVVFDRGPLVDAIRASISVPGLFVPAQLDGRLLIDGGVASPLPVGVARALGAEVVIGVDVLVPPEEKRIEQPNVFTVLFQMGTIFQKRLAALSAEIDPPDVLLVPEFGDPPPTYAAIGNGVEAGYRAAEVALPHLQKLLTAP
ncbi:MAG: patatin-like phospholipase family protein [Candidatus Bipolaricaulaceae bacterium]